MLINADLSSKFPSHNIVVGPVGTLVLEGTENLQIVLSVIGADEMLSTDRRYSSLDSRETSEG
jgi:hypothetical protein